MAACASSTTRRTRSPRPRRIGLVDADSQVVAEIRDLVATLDHGEWELCVASNGRDALRRLPEVAPELVLVSTWHGQPSSLECVKALASALPSTPLFVLAAPAKDHNLFAAFNAGATGCVIRPVSREIFKQAVASASEHKFYLCDRARQQLFRDIRDGRHGLSPILSQREQDIADLLIGGLVEKEIADKLNLKRGTVHEYIQRLYNKLGIHRRTEMARALMTARNTSGPEDRVRCVRKEPQMDTASLEVEDWQKKARAASYSVRALAKSCGVCTRSLEMFFQQMVGETPRQWLHKLRMSDAVKFLRDGNYVGETANLLGYRARSHFSREFRKVYGNTPKTLRSEAKSKPRRDVFRIKAQKIRISSHPKASTPRNPVLQSDKTMLPN